jgi:antitoxin HigA-1
MELDARGISKTTFAEALGLKISNLSGLLHQNRHVNAEVALKLEALLGIDAEF